MNKALAKFLDLTDAARQGLRSSLKSFRQQSVYSQRRTYVIVAYVVVVLATVIILPPPSEKNPLGVKVVAGTLEFGSRKKTYLEITNESSKEWPEAEVLVRGMYERKDGRGPVKGVWLNRSRWRAGEKRNLFPEDFKDPDGFSPEIELRVDEVRLTVGKEKYLKKMAPPGQRK